MKLKICAAYVLAAAMLSPTFAAHADNVDDDHPMNLVKDSAITVAIKSKLAANKTSSLKEVKVETDSRGVVWLSGSAVTQTLINQAESIARNTSGVVDVHNQITIKTDF